MTPKYNRNYYRSSIWMKISACIACLILLTFGCQDATPQPTPEVLSGPEQDLAGVVSATGVIVPARWATLSVSSAGIVADVFIAEGEKVEAGQPLLRLSGGDPQKPSPELRTALLARELEVDAAQKALDNLDDAAQARLLQAEQVLNSVPSAIRDLQYQLASLDIPEEQAGMAPLEAYDLAFEAYQNAEEAFKPYKGEPTVDKDRRDRKEDLDQAKEDYDIAIQRLQLSLALETALANRDQARKDYKTYKDGPTDDEKIEAQRRLESARSALEYAQAAVASLTLNAPFAGTVSEIHVKVGEWVSPGIPAIVLADLDNLLIETTDMNEIDMTRIKVGDRASLSFDALADVTLSGEVVYIAPKALPGSGVNYKAVIELDSPSPSLRWGMSVFVDILPKP